MNAVIIVGYFFLGPRPSAPQILSLQFQGIVLTWRGWSIKIIHKNVAIFKNTTYIINRRMFRVLFVQGTFSIAAICQLRISIVTSENTTNIKVCVLRGLSGDLTKVWNWDILRVCAIEKLHNAIGGNLETNFIKRHWIELRHVAGFLSHNSTGK